MIPCPKCGTGTHVIETRRTQDHARRRRICKSTSCGMKITTMETIIGRGSIPSLVVIKRRELETVQRLVAALLPLPPTVLPTSADEEQD